MVEFKVENKECAITLGKMGAKKVFVYEENTHYHFILVEGELFYISEKEYKLLQQWREL